MVTEGPSTSASPHGFLDLPFELRSQIIKLSIGSIRPTSKSRRRNFKTEFEIEPHDFTISATGLKCHFVTSFNLFAVNRQLRRESMAIIFQNASVCLQVEIPRYGGMSAVAASVSGFLNILKAYPILCDSAQKVTVIILPETAYVSGPFIEMDGGIVPLIKEQPKILVLIGLFVCIAGPVIALGMLANLIHKNVPFQRRHSELQAIIDTLLNDFRSRKSLKIILYLNDLFLQDLRIILGLFKASSCSITFEERWIQWYYPVIRDRVIEQYEVDYRKFVEAATKEAGQHFFPTVCPTFEEFEVEETDDGDTRGSKIIGKRKRTWLEDDL